MSQAETFLGDENYEIRSHEVEVILDRYGPKLNPANNYQREPKYKTYLESMNTS
jgi:hypothetical protein